MFDIIVGNPPFVKTRKGNLAIDFVYKCFGLLREKGELIFIVPADFFKLTSTGNLINEMMQIGTFTDIFHPEEENLFEDASINVMIFRYCKNKKLEKKCLYNDIQKNIINNNGLLIFTENKVNNIKLFENYFDIYVGLVSGKEEVYKNEELGNIEVLNGENKIDKYIFIENFPCNNDKINQHLLLLKQ